MSRRCLTALCAAISSVVFTAVADAQIYTEATAATSTAQRSVSLNNYNNWTFEVDDPTNQGLEMDILSVRENITFTEYWERHGVTPYVIKDMNPGAKVYRLYDLMVKNTWDPDWSNPIDRSRMQTPLTRAEIDANDWWLRDGNGNVVKDAGGTGWFIDVGKPGVKEAFLEAALARNSGEGFDGFVFDYWWSEISTLLRGLPRPERYPTDNWWFETAWKPFITYVTEGLQSAGYRVIGNSVGQYDDPRSTIQWQRTQVDGVIYEQFAVGWSGEWLAGPVIERRINSFRRDPLECWTADFGLTGSDPRYSQKASVALAMYYIAVPGGQNTRSYHHRRNGKIFWESLWDFDIGVPNASPVKLNGVYFWRREFTRGMVLLNYDSKNMTYRLGQRYRDPQGKLVAGKVTIPPHTGVVLAVAS